MADPYKRYRVTLLDTFHGDNNFEFCRAVSEFAEPMRHWKFVGTVGLSQFSRWEDLPWDGVDGVMMVGLDRVRAGWVASKGVPTVSVTPDDLDSPLPTVTSDFHAVGRMGAEHLLERGYTNFAYLGEATWPSAEQEAGFVETIRAAGRTCVTRTLNVQAVATVLDELRECLQELPKPIGIMAVMDYMARYATNIAAEMELRVPADVGILGVNNNRWASIMAAVPLSSIELDDRRLGQVTARTLETLMQRGTVEPMQRIPPLRVVTRRSTDTILTQNPLVGRALQFIREHADEGIEVEDVLSDLGCSRSTLEKRMKQELGYTAHTAITRARVEKVKKMLLSTEASTEQIAIHCGFEHQARLFETFKRVTGMTPAAYRRSMRGATTV